MYGSEVSTCLDKVAGLWESEFGIRVDSAGLKKTKEKKFIIFVSFIVIFIKKNKDICLRSFMYTVDDCEYI